MHRERVLRYVLCIAIGATGRAVGPLRVRISALAGCAYRLSHPCARVHSRCAVLFCSLPQLKSLSKALKEISEAKEESAELDAKKAALQKRYVALAHGSTQMLLCLGLLGFYNKPRLTGFFGVCTSALVRCTTTTYSHAVTIGLGQCKDDSCDGILY